MSCNEVVREHRALALLVSIPIGFSNELQRGPDDSRAVGGVLVSIPIGFSNELQRHAQEAPR